MTEIAICITTRNRREAFNKCYNEWFKYLPDNASIFVVDDASEPRYVHDYDYYFTERAGIPTVKNKCLELAMQSGAKWIILVDDDIYPICKDWHLPYINSGQNHLCFTWPEKYQNMPAKKFYEKDGLMHYSLGNGSFMFFTRECIETVGGFRTEYGMGCFEHVDLSSRIYRAGLIPSPFIDVVGSDKLLYSMDQYSEVQRSFTDQERAELIQANYPIFAQKRFDIKFVPYDSRK